MEKLNINADIRNTEESTKQIRDLKKLPGVVYSKHQDPISLILDSSEFLKLYRKVGESNIFNLLVGKKEIEVLVHDTQREPVTGDFTHVDLYAITRGEKLHAKIHLNFIGNSPAAKEGAIIEELHKEIEVKCLPRDLVDHFDVDLSILKEFGDNIKVEDLVINKSKYEVITHLDEVIVLAGKPAKVTTEVTTEEITEEEK